MSTTGAAVPEAVGAMPETETLVSRPGLLRHLLRDRTALLGLTIVSVLMLAALLAPLLAPHDPNMVTAPQFAVRSGSHPLGADHLGRDILSRLLFGARVSIGATVVATALISVVGLIAGLLAGYLGGVVDMAVSRVIDVLQAFPGLLLALAVTGALGLGLRNLIIAMTVAGWAGHARIVRSAVLTVRERAYVDAAHSYGSTDLRILWRHLVPNIVAPLIVLTSVDMGAILLGIAGLSFLGLGVSSPTAEWGSMLSEASAYIGPAPRLMVYPGAAIFLFVLGFNLLGDGLRDALDPRATAAGR